MQSAAEVTGGACWKKPKQLVRAPKCSRLGQGEEGAAAGACKALFRNQPGSGGTPGKGKISEVTPEQG